ncbi:hypothetical protein ZWY2020_059609 [Hordeum vulgare]|nr:hypothetical protein ZWY2020_059609 [Hordeum vulgare]
MDLWFDATVRYKFLELVTTSASTLSMKRPLVLMLIEASEQGRMSCDQLLNLLELCILDDEGPLRSYGKRTIDAKASGVLDSPTGSDLDANPMSFSAFPGDKAAFEPLNPEDVRAYLHKAVDFISDYYTNVESMPVLPNVKPGYLQDELSASPPTYSARSTPL